MKIEITQLYERTDGLHYIEIYPLSNEGAYSLDQIEDLEINLTDIIKQLQDYRIKQNHD